MAVEIHVKLSEREAEAVLRAEFSVGHGVKRSQACMFEPAEVQAILELSRKRGLDAKELVNQLVKEASE
jgi:hypothetical protein